MDLLVIVISIGAGVIAGNGAVYIFNKIPGSWLCDYGIEPDEELKNPTRQRVNSVPWKYALSIMFIGIGMKLGLQDYLYAIAAFFAIWLLVEIFMADQKYMIIPDQFIILLCITAFGFIPFNQERGALTPALSSLPPAFVYGLFGALTGLLIMMVVYGLGKLIYKKEALGFGDVKLCVAIGLIVGPVGICLIIAFSSFLAGCVYAVGVIRKKYSLDAQKPLGTFISATTILYLLFAPDFII